ncbi:HEAT repeat domain-containing protein [Candidatus Woesearchaeota archaeon]|nr:HEAT repeat domain-containing protein [Candidatus Woesearchaeota archaeon]
MFGKKEAFLILIVVLSLIIFNVNKENITGMQVAETTTFADSCLTEPTPEILWNLYSKIPEYKDDNERIIQAALNGWDSWTSNNPGRATKTRAEIEAGLRRIAESGGIVCIDDYSLLEKDDCWGINWNALCVENKCVDFKDMGWNEDVLRYMLSVKRSLNGFMYIPETNEQRILDFLNDRNSPLSNDLKAILLIKLLDKEYRDFPTIAAMKLGEIRSLKAVPPLIRNLEDPSMYMIARINAAFALRSIGSEEAISALIRNYGREIETERNIVSSIARAFTSGYEDNEDLISNSLIFSKFYSEFLSLIVENIHKVEQDYNSALFMFLIFVNLKESDKEVVGYDADYFLDNLDPMTSPPETLGLLKRISLFDRIYSNRRLRFFSYEEKNSISISVYRYIIRDTTTYRDVEDARINEMIDLILDKRDIFENEIILGENKYLIVFSHEDPNMDPNRIKQFAVERGVRDFNNHLLKGPSSKLDIKWAIINSRNRGETVIWSDVHGLLNYVCLGGGISNRGDRTKEESCSGFKYDEFADILLIRGNLHEITLIIDSCLSYNFAEQLINDLKEKNSRYFPTIIVETGKGRYGGFNIFLDSLKSLNLPIGDPLIGRHIFGSEQSSLRFQDSAVFFSEDGISPSLEIAMSTLNPTQCGECTGDYCPVSLPEEATS